MNFFKEKITFTRNEYENTDKLLNFEYFVRVGFGSKLSPTLELESNAYGSVRFVELR